MAAGDRSLRGSVVVVTGGASGIGLALGTSMASLGARVVLADCDGEAAAVSAGRLADRGLDVSSVELDVTDRDAFARLAAELVEAHGRIDFLVNSAGIAMGAPHTS
jgi:NAD(P)-dependent dehydrogenase (short-subunit alcohol dehydrogenase family)